MGFFGHIVHQNVGGDNRYRMVLVTDFLQFDFLGGCLVSHRHSRSLGFHRIHLLHKQSPGPSSEGSSVSGQSTSVCTLHSDPQDLHDGTQHHRAPPAFPLLHPQLHQLAVAATRHTLSVLSARHRPLLPTDWLNLPRPQPQQPRRGGLCHWPRYVPLHRPPHHTGHLLPVHGWPVVCNHAVRTALPHDSHADPVHAVLQTTHEPNEGGYAHLRHLLCARLSYTGVHLSPQHTYYLLHHSRDLLPWYKGRW
mmetsp:Transcript_3340/g.5066  ORF Transcript_3340/g.5066 Transcript_3340/m.5066 type:complete len:250 (+) Transcript_3340:398-1147(+)